jgi:hypothetical protein
MTTTVATVDRREVGKRGFKILVRPGKGELMKTIYRQMRLVQVLTLVELMIVVIRKRAAAAFDGLEAVLAGATIEEKREVSRAGIRQRRGN